MPKIDKSLYSKKQFKLIQEYRRKQKEQLRINQQAEEQSRLIAERSAEMKQQKQTNAEKSHEDKKSKIGFVLGNGSSRHQLPLENLKSFGKVYGCNALYRSYEPDFLIAVDAKMIIEINKSGYQKTHEVWTNPNRAYLKFKHFNYFNPSKGWSSGPTALWLASQHGYETIYIFGFDYRGLKDGQRFNNIYADTPNYKKSTDTATYFGNWMRQTTSVIESNPKINYVRVVSDTCYLPKDLAKYNNFKTLNYREFLPILREK